MKNETQSVIANEIRKIDQNIAEQKRIRAKLVETLDFISRSGYETEIPPLSPVDRQRKSDVVRKKKTHDMVDGALIQSGRVLKSRELYEAVKKERGEDYKFSTFRPQLSTMVKKGKVMQYKDPNAQQNDRYYYARPSWYSGDSIMPEYLNEKPKRDGLFDDENE